MLSIRIGVFDVRFVSDTRRDDEFLRADSFGREEHSGDDQSDLQAGAIQHRWNSKIDEGDEIVVPALAAPDEPEASATEQYRR